MLYLRQLPRAFFICYSANAQHNDRINTSGITAEKRAPDHRLHVPFLLQIVPFDKFVHSAASTVLLRIKQAAR